MAYTPSCRERNGISQGAGRKYLVFNLKKKIKNTKNPKTIRRIDADLCVRLTDVTDANTKSLYSFIIHSNRIVCFS